MMTRLTGVPLTLISGWGSPAAMIESWVAPLSSDVIRYSLDDDLLAEQASIDAVVDRITGGPHGRRLLVGWSLGGQIAMAAALLRPERVTGVITFGASPSFAARPDWPWGLSASDFSGFQRGLDRDWRRQWTHFLFLQVRGASNEAAARRALQPWLDAGPPASESVLRHSLAWLAAWDQRSDWQRLRVPSRHLFGDRDSLVQVAVADRLRAMGLDARVMNALTHWPLSGGAGRISEQIEEFARDCGLG